VENTKANHSIQPMEASRSFTFHSLPSGGWLPPLMLDVDMARMTRVPCQICGAEVLPATYERNDGLCGRCAKGDRPCIYCGQHVSEPLKDGTYAHVECWIRNRQVEESLGWKKVEDIDWGMIRQLLRTAATRLFQKVAREHHDSGTVKLVFFVRIQDFVEVTVHEVQADGSSKRLSDPQWDKDLSPVDSSFSRMYEALPEQDALDASGTVERTLMDILSDTGKELAKHNFYFPSHVQISWSTKSA
jgi:hypothetical protein